MRVKPQVKEESRRALLAAAARAFAERGYHGTGIDRVSVDAGLAKGTVYNYFASKRDIFESVLLEACALAAEAADSVPASVPVRRRLEAFVAGNLAWSRADPALATVFARTLTAGDAADRGLILEAAMPCVEKVAEILDAAVERRELILEAPSRALAVTFIVLANVLLLQADEGGIGWPDADMLPTVAAGLFLEGLPGLDAA
ncbi:MAG TPA: helix-turn-helix domain-containing protein [Solirubrobacterales bacterium]|nr:helix-turn-helix domain-containing protein [Solirubrobacterales bacterium]